MYYSVFISLLFIIKCIYRTTKKNDSKIRKLYVDKRVRMLRKNIKTKTYRLKFEYKSEDEDIRLMNFTLSIPIPRNMFTIFALDTFTFDITTITHVTSSFP